MDNDLPSNVREFKLATEFRRRRQTVHFYDDPDAPPSSGQWSELWKSEKEPIGQGGQGKVYLQNCTRGSRHYTQRAVKVIPLQAASGRRRYLGELETIIKFSHHKYSKYFVKSLGWYESDASLFIAMEYIPMGDLQTYLNKHAPLPENDACQIVSQVLRGLSVMHEEGFAHRDVKPKNILIQQCPTTEKPSSWWIKLSDFGIIKRLGAVTSGASTVIGTPAYIAPEFLRPGRRVLSNVNYPAADMWALGVMTFFILTNTYPFIEYWDITGYRSTPLELFPHGPLDKSDISPDGRSFVYDLMNPEPNERPGSDAAFHHRWLWPCLPNAQIISDSHSQSSTSSSGTSSLDEMEGMTTVASNITDLVSSFPKGSATQLPQYTNSTELSSESPNDNISISHVEEFSTKLSIQDQVQTPVVPDQAHGEVSTDITLTSDVEDFSTKLSIVDQVQTPVPPGPANGWTPIHIASQNGQIKVVELLFERGADIQAQTREGWTPIYLASLRGQTQVIEFLLEKGADIMIPNKAGRTPIHAASQNGSLEVVKLLFEHGADITIPTSYHGQLQVVEFLFEHGADITIPCQDEWTPINIASTAGHTEVVKFLFKNGADTTIPNKYGWTPINSASDAGHVKYRWTPIHIASYAGHTEVVKFLFESGADITVPNKNGWTPINSASYAGHIEIVKFLFENGADITLPAKLGRTPIHSASIAGQTEVVKFLLENEADTEILDNEEHTPFMGSYVMHRIWKTK
ncbi:ankyrin repeat-containing domain protein [Trichoderma barbatum]